MNDIEQKALALLNEVRAEREYTYKHTSINREADLAEALCRAIEQHEAFRQEVSDIVEAYVNATDVDDWEKLKALIIPKPKPDPLVALIEEFGWYRNVGEMQASLEARGLEIREKNDD